MYAVGTLDKQDKLKEIYKKATTESWVFDRVEEDRSVKKYCGVEDIFFTQEQQKELAANRFLVFKTADECGLWQLQYGQFDDFGNVIEEIKL